MESIRDYEETIMGFFSSEPKISSEEMDKCRAWLGKQYKLTAFQIREADLHNNTLVEYGNSIGINSKATRAMV
ncbi:hypothetical protein ACFLU4_07895 [Chloroflexota bacterium]